MASAPAPPSLTATLVDELARALAARLGGTGRLESAGREIGAGWTVSVTVGQPAAGRIAISLERADGPALVRAMTGDEDADGTAVAGALGGWVGQAVAALRDRPEARGLLFCVDSPVATMDGPGSDATTYAIAAGGEFAPVIAVSAAFESQAAFEPASAGAPPAGGRPSSSAPTAPVPPNLDVILDIDLPLSVRFGQTDLSLESLTRLGPGSVIDLGRSPDDPVEVLVNGRLVARAEVVVVGGNYGVRITEVVSPADRVRSLSS
jgi:flagellar motor switch protein FliN